MMGLMKLKKLFRRGLSVSQGNEAVVWASPYKQKFDMKGQPEIVTKFRGRAWPDENDAGSWDNMPEVNSKYMSRKAQGYHIKSKYFPEASALCRGEDFSKAEDLFWADGFEVVKGGLAKCLMDADLGPGGRVLPYLVYENDKVTPVSEPCYNFNFVGQKDALIGELSNRLKLLVSKEEMVNPEVGNTKHDLFVAREPADYDIVVSSPALEGAEVWYDRSLPRFVFFSNRLVEAIRKSGTNADLDFLACRVETSKEI